MISKRALVTAACVAAAAVVTGFIAYYGIHEKKPREFRLVYIPKTLDTTNDFWIYMMEGCRKAAEDYGAQLEVMVPESELDIEGQKELIRKAVSERPDAILLTPSTMEKNEDLKNARDSGIFVTFIDSYAEGGYEKLLVATDNVEAGKTLGSYAASLIEPGTQIAVVSHVKDTSTSGEREKGFREGLGGQADQIVETVYCNSSYELAYDLAEELMEKYPDLGLIAGMNEYSSTGAARAVDDHGKAGKIKVVGIDSSEEMVRLMEKGVFQGIVVQRAFKMGYLGVEQTIKRLTNHNTGESFINSGSELVTRENMYDEDFAKLIFPFDWQRTESPWE